MSAYIILTLVLLALGYWETVLQKRNPVPLTIATVVTVLFVGLRFETGADWVEYETLLHMTAPLFSNMPMYFNPNLVVEPGFAALLALINLLHLPFQILLLFSAVFSIGAMSIFFWNYSKEPTLVLLWYCGFGLLLGQMAAIRQVIAYSLLIIAFIAYDKRQVFGSILWSLAAVSMHVFAFVLVPVLYLRLTPPKTRTVLTLCGIGLATSIAGISIFALLIAPISLILGGIVSTKLEIYGNAAAFRISFFASLLIVWHMAVLVLLNRREMEAWSLPVVRCAIYAAIWSLVAHTYLGTLPAIWNRVMLFSMPLEILALFRCYSGVLRDTNGRLAASLGVWVVSASSISYGLSQENALPYLPYQSIAQVWITDNPGDGRLRYFIEQERLNRRSEEQRQP